MRRPRGGRLARHCSGKGPLETTAAARSPGRDRPGNGPAAAFSGLERADKSASTRRASAAESGSGWNDRAR